MSSFCTAKATHIFSAKNFSVSLDQNFNELLTNDIVSSEQLGPALLPINGHKTNNISGAILDS